MARAWPTMSWISLLLSLASCWAVEEAEPCTPQFKLGDRIKVTLRNELPPEGSAKPISGCKEAYGLLEGTELEMTMSRKVNAPGCTALVPSVTLARYVMTPKGEEDHEALSNEFDAILDGRCPMLVRIELEADWPNRASVPSRVMPDGSHDFTFSWSSTSRAADAGSCPSSCPVHFAVDVARVEP